MRERLRWCIIRWLLKPQEFDIMWRALHSYRQSLGSSKVDNPVEASQEVFDIGAKLCGYYYR